MSGDTLCTTIHSIHSHLSCVVRFIHSKHAHAVMCTTRVSLLRSGWRFIISARFAIILPLSSCCLKQKEEA